MSFLEVYNEEVRDLLSRQAGKALEVREHRASRVYVKGLTAIVVKSASEMERVLEARPLSIALPLTVITINVIRAFIHGSALEGNIGFCYVLQVGKKNRAVGSTLMNQESSRSHSMFTVTVEMAEGVTSEVALPRVQSLRTQYYISNNSPGILGTQ